MSASRRTRARPGSEWRARSAAIRRIRGATTTCAAEFLRSLIPIRWCEPPRECRTPSATRIAAAWLLLQHDSAYQAELLPRLEAEPANEIAPADLAMLEDCVRVTTGRPQRYGSQLDAIVEGQPLRYSPIDDPAGVEARRASVGLPPLRVYSCMMRVMYGRPVTPPDDSRRLK